MAIRTTIKDGKKLFEVYVNGFNAQGTRVQRKRTNIESLRKAEVIEFELKRELAILKESKVDPRWEEWTGAHLHQISDLPSTWHPSEPEAKSFLGRNSRCRPRCIEGRV